jgi:hypothetical protein
MVTNSFLEILVIRSHNIPVEHTYIFGGIDSIFTALLVKYFAPTHDSVLFGCLAHSRHLP